MAQAVVCDVDTDGDVDRLDIRLIISARNTPAGGSDDPRDADGDGTITVPDARICLRQCNLPGCTTIDPTPSSSSPTDGASQFNASKATPIQKAVEDVRKPNTATSSQLSADIQRGTMVSGTEWKVARGDTLYAISRAVYPKDARKQARLRQDIVELNPSVFASGTNSMAVGVVLKLPDYVVSQSAPSSVGEPAQVTAPIPDTVTPKPASQLADSDPVVKVEPEKQARKEPSTEKEHSTSSPTGVKGNALVSLGYSYGGDKLVYEDGSYDPAGSGAHLRLGYEQMYQHGGGYRIALGLQYGIAGSAGDATLRDNYLQLTYQYRANAFAYGIGAVFHQGASITGNSSADFDAANGAVVYMENIGSSDLAGWGLSYTSLEIEEKDSSKSFDASRAELYYSWRF